MSLKIENFFLRTFLKWVAWGVGVGVIVVALAVWVCGCDSPPQQQRETPFAVWCFEDAKALADSTGFDYLLPDAHYDFGDVITMPNEWNVFQFIVPPRMWDHEYVFQWAPPGGELEWWYETLAIALVDSMDTGMLWFAVYGIRDGDRVKLVEP